MRAVGTKAQRLLEAARSGDEPSAAQVAALGERLFSAVAANASMGLDAARVSATPAQSLALSAKWIASAVLGTIGVASVALFVGLEREPPSAAPPSAAVSSSSSAIAAQPLPPSPNVATTSPAPDLPARDAAPARGRAAAVAAPALRLEEESALLAASQRALSRGELAVALSHLDQYDERFPTGVLRTEAATARVLVLCSGAAPLSYARKAAQRFLARYPRSPARARVVRVCGL